MRDRARRTAREARRAARVRWIERRRALWGPGTDWQRLLDAGLFDPGWYRDTYPDVASSGLEPLAHFAAMGAGQGRNPNRWFDTVWYRTTYRDVMADVAHPVFDYLDRGAAAGRHPGPEFDSQWYTSTYPDVARSGVTPLGHYLVNGAAEGRLRRPPHVRHAGGRHVVVVSGEPTTPGHQYRAVRLAEAVERSGSTAVVLTVAEAASARAGELARADVTVLWRTGWSTELRDVIARSVRAQATVVFDIDDLMFDPALATADVIDGIRSQGLAERDVREMYSLVRQAAVHAQAATCTTPELARHLRTLGLVTHVVPNGFDDETFVRSRLAARRRRQAGGAGLCRIGYASGSRTHQRDFAGVAEAVADVLRAHPHTRLVVFRRAFDLDEFPMFDDLRAQVEWRDVVPLEGLADELARLDVNIVPLEVGNPFCEAKSELKHFEAALVDVPTVASPTGPFQRAISHGVTGMLADGPDEWREALDKLVTDPELRAAMGRAARDAVCWPFGPERRAQRVAAILDQICGDEAASAAAFELERARDRRSVPEPPALVPARTVLCRDRLRASLVTIVVPVHDYAHTVVEALDSVAAQTLTDLDLVVVDDGSSDDSLATVSAWVEQHADRFNRAVVLAHPENAGLACTRNRGFADAETPYVLPLDADNVLLPRCAARLLEALETSGAAFAFPQMRMFGPGLDPRVAEGVMGGHEFAPGRLVDGNYIDALALVRRTAWLRVGGYRPGLSGWEDYDLWCAFAEAGLAGRRVAEDLARYRVHEASMLRTVTHAGDTLARARAAVAERHAWLDLDTRTDADGRLPDALDVVAPEGLGHDAVGSVDTRATDAARDALAPGGLASSGAGPSGNGPFGNGAEAGGAGAGGAGAGGAEAGGAEAGGAHAGPVVERAAAMTPAPLASPRERAVAATSGAQLSARARDLLPLLRCPETGESLEQAPDGGLRTTVTGRRWPVVAGRPVLFPGMDAPEVIAASHAGNPLPERARALVAASRGPVLHLSGGGTAVDGDHVVDVDAAVFASTDVVGDAHRLPFADGTFDLVVAMNAFEHYRDPQGVAATLHRVLRPGGVVFVHTAFLQPLHEEPHHYFNTTRYGLEQWFAAFDTVDLTVSDNFLPGFALSWLASEAEAALDRDVSATEAAAFRATPMGRFSDFWRDPATRVGDERWAAFASLRPDSQERLAAGFEYLGRRPPAPDAPPAPALGE